MGKKIVLGVIGSDAHAVGNTILNNALTEAGFDVTNIGVLSPQEEFINAALETDAEAILVSSLYGQGELDVQGFKDKCDEAGLGHVKLLIGGNIVVGKQDWDEVHQRFVELGFDKVYKPGTPVQTTIDDLNELLGE